jgi:acyl carrier protein
MNRDEIIENLNSVFRKVFKDKDIVIFEEMTSKDVEKWDSLTHLVLISETEDMFKIKFKLKELIAMKNVGEFIASIDRKVNI